MNQRNDHGIQPREREVQCRMCSPFQIGQHISRDGTARLGMGVTTWNVSGLCDKHEDERLYNWMEGK